MDKHGVKKIILSSTATLFDDPERINSELARIQAVTSTDLAAHAEAFLGADNRAVLTYLPEADG